MAVSAEDLDNLLSSVEDFITAKEAIAKSVSNEPSLAKSTLQLLIGKINEKIAKTQRSLIEKVPISNESPAISLVIAALEKKGYILDVSGDKSYTQFIVSW